MIDRRTAAALPALLLMAGCAGSVGGYPSLAPRPVEREVMQAQPAPAAPVAPAPLPPSADIAQILASAQGADAAFKAAVETARPRIEAGRSAAQGSEAWVLAQQAYSNAEAATAPVSDALAELDRRQQAAATDGDAARQAAIADATQQVQALFEAERAVLGQLLPA